MAETDTNPRLIETDDKAIFRTRTNNPQDYLAVKLDREWGKRSFMVSDGQLDDALDIMNRYHSSADFKFTDTRLGKNIGINSRPQFTRYSDIRRRGRLKSRAPVTTISTNGNYGMGRYYSEAIDDAAQTIFLRFGVPEYTSVADFLARAFDPDSLHLAKTGRASNILFKIGQNIGGFVGIVAYPQIAAIMFIGKLANAIFTKPRYKYYTLKPTMHSYWSCVNLLVNTIAIRLKILPTVLADEKDQLLGRPIKLQESAIKTMHELLPDIISEEGYIDVFAMANQAQLAANKVFLEEYDAIDVGSKHNYEGYLLYENDRDKPLDNYYLSDSVFSNKETGTTLLAFIEKYTMTSEWFKPKTEDAEKAKAEVSPTINPETGAFDAEKAKDKNTKSTFTQYLDAEFRSGSQYAIFKVDYTGNVTDSFSNATKESEISQKINSTVSQIRDVKFSVGQFKLPGAIGSAIGSLMSGVESVVQGAVSGVTFGLSDAVTGIFSNSFIDIPKHWQSSTADLPKANYHMTLISPYGNPISLLQNIYIPLSMLMAGTLPLAGGKASYTSPFICQLFDRGKIQIQLGMIESLTITRGVSNLGFTQHNKPLAIDVSLSIVDLSSIMTMPVAPAGVKDALLSAVGAPGAAAAGSFGTYNPAIDEDSILSDYIAVLAGQDIYSQIYPLAKGKLRAAEMLIKAKALSSPAAWAMLTGESASSGLLQYSPIGLAHFIIDGTQAPAGIRNQTQY